MKKIYLLICSLICIVTGAIAQYTTLHTFGGADGKYPDGCVTYYGKRLFGMTKDGGANGYGCVFSVDTNGNYFKNIYSFDNTKGAYPWGSVVVSGNKIYGMTYLGGANSTGVVFSVDTNGGGYKDMVDLGDSTGKYSYGSLTLLRDKLYGLTGTAGRYGGGTLFSIDTNGNGFTVIHHFGAYPDGYNASADLVLVGNKFYGTTGGGGPNSDGTIFSIDTNGTGYNVMMNFSANTNLGGGPNCDLTPVGNKFYGTTVSGGPSNAGVIFSIGINGSGYDTVMSFNSLNGGAPHGSVTLLGNKLYGMSIKGGPLDYGVVFSIDTNAGAPAFKDLVYFNDTIGTVPWGSLTLIDGTLYGMTGQQGELGTGFGTVFKLSKGITGINTLSANPETIKLFPNPNNGVFTIGSKAVGGPTTVEIYNMFGEEIYSQFNINNSTFNIDLGTKSSGVYLYRVIAETGDVISEGKFIIEAQ